jgi:hypothetical protein
MFGSSVRYFHERAKDHFVIWIGEYMRGEALEDCGSRFAIEPRSAKRCKELPLDFLRTWIGLLFVHSSKHY